MMKFFGRGTPGESLQSASSPTLLPAAPSNISAGPARPIRLVYTDEKGKFYLDPEAVALLQFVKQPVGVVSVCGRARQGKSFILNQNPAELPVSLLHLRDRDRRISSPSSRPPSPS